MPTYVLYDGRLIDKRYLPASYRALSDLPAPMTQSFTSYTSPIDGQNISSHRQRERDLHHSGSYDPRDTPAAFRKARDVRYQQQRRRAVTTEP
jgi:hypothetical protein